MLVSQMPESWDRLALIVNGKEKWHGLLWRNGCTHYKITGLAICSGNVSSMKKEG